MLTPMKTYDSVWGSKSDDGSNKKCIYYCICYTYIYEQIATIEGDKMSERERERVLLGNELTSFKSKKKTLKFIVHFN